MTHNRIRPAEVFAPGEYLRDELAARGWTQSRFAEIIGRPLPTVNGIINGKISITAQTAKELGAAFGTSAEMWMNMQIAYDLFRTEVNIKEIKKRAAVAVA
jgi:HTH-type transcriptional regulator/antitoxin HigA